MTNAKTQRSRDAVRQSRNRTPRSVWRRHTAIRDITEQLKKQVNELCARLGQPPRYGTELDEEFRAVPLR
jgi:hypothetical protein